MKTVTLFLLTLLLASWAGAQGAPDPLQDRLRVLDAVIPADWERFRQREPVFDSELFWVEAGPVGADTVLLVHGLGQDGLRSLMPALVALVPKYRIIALDLPGFGLSEEPRGHYSPTHYARVLHWLLKERATGPVAVVGHSMGGAVALRFAGSYPQQLERLVLVSSAGVLERTAFLKHAASLPVGLDGAPDAVSGLVDSLRQYSGTLLEWTSLLPDPARLLQSSETVWNALTGGQPNINAALCLVGEDYSEVIARLEVPTYIIWGTEDAVTPPRTGRLLAGRLARAQLAEIIGAGHMPMFTHPELFNQLLGEALTARGPGPAFWQRPSRVRRPPDLQCRDSEGEHYQGYYRRVVLDNCQSASLMNVTAESLTIVDSSVAIYNLSLNAAEGAALSIANSELQLTNAEIVGAVGISTSASTLDLAGVSLRVEDKGVVSTLSSALNLSASDLESPGFRGFLHDNYRLENTSLDAQLR